MNPQVSLLAGWTVGWFVGLLLFPDLKTQASFVFLLQKFCGNSAKLLRKNFVNFDGIANFLFGDLDSWNYLRKNNTEKINFTYK